jgi:hypothetical protein
LDTPESKATLDVEYTPPVVIEIGTLRELTLGCDKRLGDSDGFTFQGQQIVCSSA